MTPEITYQPGFISGPDALLDEAMGSLSWDDRMRSRRTASCGIAYNYSGISYPDTEMPGFIAEIAARIAGLVGHPINNCLANLYQSGASTMGFHSDSSEGVVPGTTTSIVSLGSERVLTFRLMRDRSQTHELRLGSGSLLIMASRVQDEWEHALLRAGEAGVRISLTFRHLMPRS